jgi:hypothetical protein
VEPGDALTLVSDRLERFEELADRLEAELAAAGRGVVFLTVDCDNFRMVSVQGPAPLAARAFAQALGAIATLPPGVASSTWVRVELRYLGGVWPFG